MSAPTPTWVINQILGFFNQARTVDEIVNGPIKDDPSDGAGRTIGPSLAARILREKNALPRRRFTDFDQLDRIKGVGEGTIQDLVYSFGTPAAKAFQERMYDGTIFQENWTLEYNSTSFESQKEFNELVRDEAAFRAWVVQKVRAIAIDRGANEDQQAKMVDNLQSTYVDTYSNVIPAPGYALALWLYEFDADNWFGWEQIQQQTEAYFAHHLGYPWEMELRFFKGFQQQGIIRAGIAADDLPVVVNWPEKAITLWFSALYD